VRCKAYSGTAIAAIGAALSAGCGAGAQVAAGLEGARDVIAVAEPCLVAAKERDLASCANAPNVALCESQAQAAWEPIAVALDAFHAAWCSLSPSSEGCAK